MSLGGGPFENADRQARADRLAAQADAARALRLSGHKSPLRRLLGRLRPHRQGLGSSPQNMYGTQSNPERPRT